MLSSVVSEPIGCNIGMVALCIFHIYNKVRTYAMWRVYKVILVTYMLQLTQLQKIVYRDCVMGRVEIIVTKKSGDRQLVTLYSVACHYVSIHYGYR